jgi:catechol-2,3-dioxygenase
MAETHVADTLLPQEKPRPALKLRFLSHGTLESRDLAFSRRFYEEFLGLEIVQTSPTFRQLTEAKRRKRNWRLKSATKAIDEWLKGLSSR